jgi:hypothetical protein
LLCASVVARCGDPDPIPADRYQSSDYLVSVLEANVSESPQLEKIVTIDHSRLGAEAGSVMPRAKVLIFSNSFLESQLASINPLAAIDLPLRVLAYESVTDNSTKIAFNSFEYISSRYGFRGHQGLKSIFLTTPCRQSGRYGLVWQDRFSGTRHGRRNRTASDTFAVVWRTNSRR